MSQSTEVSIHFAGHYSLEFSTGSRNLGAHFAACANGASIEISGHKLVYALSLNSTILSYEMPKVIRNALTEMVAEIKLYTAEIAYDREQQNENPMCQKDSDCRTIEFYENIDCVEFKREWEDQMYTHFIMYVKIVS